jgi:hypothetical protein
MLTTARMQPRDLPLGDGETLRIGVDFDRHGRPTLLHLATGRGTGREWREHPEAGLTIPHEETGPLIRELVMFFLTPKIDDARL